MSRSIYGKLAVTNLKKNRKSYIPYILTCIVTIAMFYIISALSVNEGMKAIPGADAMIMIMHYGMIVVGIFAVIFLFYTNSFLMKQRKKEIGIYNVLGLGKRHIAKMMICEMVIVVVVSLAVGLVGGILFSKLMFLVLLKLLKFDVILKFAVEPTAIVITLILFGCIFAVSLFYNLIQIQIANPIELLRGSNQGEKEPKTKILMTIIGVVTLGGGYYIAQTSKSPLDALGLFLIAVILVIVGTYALFTAGSIALLKILKKKKKFYYHTKHFVSVSGMMYRMKQNAVGLANICILSTMVLVMVSTTVSLYVGMDDVLKQRFPHELSVVGTDLTEEEKAFINTTIDEVTEKYDLTARYSQEYEATPFATWRQNNTFALSEKGTDMTTMNGYYGTLYLMTVDGYNLLENQDVSLKENEVLVFSPKAKLSGDTLILEGETYQVKEYLEDMNVNKESYMAIEMTYVIVPDKALIEQLKETYEASGTKFYKDMDFNESVKQQVPAFEELQETFLKNEAAFYGEFRELERDDMYGFYGVFLFLGIFLGLLFLMAMVLIIYYKQISEGYDDKERFAILQKVGMSRREVKQTIRSQIMTVFFLPLVVAVIHIAAAFKVIKNLLVVMNLTNVPLFLMCTVITVAVFAVFYAIVFAITAREYYKIVK